MNGSRFDALSRALATGPSRRSVSQFLGLLLLGSACGRRAGTESAAKGKKRRKKRRRSAGKPRGVTCASGQKPCNGLCVPSNQCCSNTECEPDQTCIGGTCVCVPESQATTCQGALCGTARHNNCGQAVSCDCPRGYDCLPNGTCARACTTDDDCAACEFVTLHPECGPANWEGQRHCVEKHVGCDAGQLCTGTQYCPRGTQCQNCGVPRCLPVLACPGECGTVDACRGGIGSCPGGGKCWQPLGGGPNRCGVVAPASCGCDSHWRCEQDHGIGAFCATFTPGGACTCGDARTTFCVEPA